VRLEGLQPPSAQVQPQNDPIVNVSARQATKKLSKAMKAPTTAIPPSPPSCWWQATDFSSGRIAPADQPGRLLGLGPKSGTNMARFYRM
jgi:hypothetical protein